MTSVTAYSSKRLRSEQTHSSFSGCPVRRSPRSIRYFPKLPEDIIASLMQFLTMPDILRCQRLSSEWRDIFNKHPRIWKVILQAQKLYYSPSLLPNALGHGPINKAVVIHLYKQKFVLYAAKWHFSPFPLSSMELQDIELTIFLGKIDLIVAKGLNRHSQLPDLKEDTEENLKLIRDCFLNHKRLDYFFNKFYNSNHKCVKWVEQLRRKLNGKERKDFKNTLTLLKTLPSIRLLDPQFREADAFTLMQVFLDSVSRFYSAINGIRLPIQERHLTKVAMMMSKSNQ